MKKKCKEKRKNPVILGSFTIICCVLFLTVGFSKFSTELGISGISAVVRVKKDIRISGISLKQTESNGISTFEDYNVKKILTEIKLPNSSSTVTYAINVLNVGNTEMALANITGLPSNLTYTVDNYNLKDKLCDDDDSSECSLGSTTTILLTIGYKDNGYDENNTTYPITLDFDFKRIFSITYRNIENNNYPKTILENETKEITFVNDIPVGVSTSGVTSYTYNSPILTLTNPTKNVTIYRKYLITYVLNGGVQASNQVTTIASNESVTLLDPYRDNYHFTGWFNNSELTGNSIKILSGVNKNITLYAGWNKYDYYLESATFDGTADTLINTGICLYCTENVNKNFKVKFTIDSVDDFYNDIENINNTQPPTILSSMNEDKSPWPGLVYRLVTNSGTTKYSMKINDSHVNSFLTYYDLNVPTTVEIVREDGVIYTKINSNKYTKVLEYASTIDTFNVPLTLGGNIDSNGDYSRFFKGSLSDVSVEFYTGNEVEVEAPYTETKGDDFYILDGVIEFNGSNYINTGINLFSEENINKDFEISLTLESAGSNTNQATLVNFKDEGQNNVWPGVAFRIKNGNNFEISARWPGEEIVSNTMQLSLPQTLHFYRINGIIYYSLGNSEKIKIIEVSPESLTTPVNSTLTFGSSINSSGSPFRYFKGTVSNITVNLY